MVVMPAHTRAYREWIRRLESGTFSESQCRQWAKAVVPIADGYAGDGFRTALERDEARDLVDRMRARPNGVELTAEHVKKGTDWIRAYGVKRGLPSWAVDGFDHFTFHGGAYDVSNGYRRPQYAPIYRLHTRDGRAVDYAASPWQQTAYGEGTSAIAWKEVSAA